MTIDPLRFNRLAEALADDVVRELAVQGVSFGERQMHELRDDLTICIRVRILDELLAAHRERPPPTEPTPELQAVEVAASLLVVVVVVALLAALLGVPW